MSAAAISSVAQAPRLSELGVIPQAAGLPGFHDDLRDAATKLVSSALIVPALASLHESPLRPTSGPFAVSNVEKRFGPLLDQQFADRVTKAAKFKLVDAIVDRYSRSVKAANS